MKENFGNKLTFNNSKSLFLRKKNNFDCTCRLANYTLATL